MGHIADHVGPFLCLVMVCIEQAGVGNRLIDLAAKSKSFCLYIFYVFSCATRLLYIMLIIGINESTNNTFLAAFVAGFGIYFTPFRL